MTVAYKIQVSPLFHQLLVNSGLIILYTMCGAAVGFPTILLPQLEEDDSDIKLDLNTASWIASIYTVIQPVAMFIISPMMQAKGRKITFIVSCMPMIVSWIIIYRATTPMQLLLGCIFQGLTIGGCLAVGPHAIAEFSSPNYRGSFLVTKSASFYIGIWFVNILGTLTKWRTTSIVMFVISFIPLFAGIIWPETPLWLAYKGYFDKCAQSFMWLRGSDEQALKELSVLIQVNKEKLSSIQTSRNLHFNIKKAIRTSIVTVKDNAFWKPAITTTFLFIMYHVTGKSALIIYAIQVYTAMGGTSKIAYSAMIIFDGLTLLGMLISCFLVKIINVRKVLFTTASIAAGFLLLTSLVLYLQRLEFHIFMRSFSLIPLSGFIFFNSLGTITIPTSAFGEILPIQYKVPLIIIGILALSGANLIVLKTAPYSFIFIGYEGTFLINALLTFLCIFVLYKFMPETRNHTLQEIVDFYEHGKFIDRNANKIEILELL